MTRFKKIFVYLSVAGVALLTAALVAGIAFYIHVHAPNVDLDGQESIAITIPRGSSYEYVVSTLNDAGILSSARRFHRVAVRKNYPDRIMPGRYVIHHGMSNNQLLNMLRLGEQQPVMLTFNSIRTGADLAAVISRQLEVDSSSIVKLLHNQELMENKGMDTLTGKLLFIPNTYEVFWNTSADQLLKRMHREYNTFWNDQRRARATEIGLSPEEVGILASIVQSETKMDDEMARVAGVFMNRLRQNIPLQADPTIIFAHGDFSIRRVLNRHLTIDSPYNTYKHTGLPPGPVYLPEPRAIDAVLNYEEHDYLFFSAKPDFSGYHSFAVTYSEHLANARRYRQALNERNIYR